MGSTSGTLPNIWCSPLHGPISLVFMFAWVHACNSCVQQLWQQRCLHALHRAALEALISCGIRRVLTSGGSHTALQVREWCFTRLTPAGVGPALPSGLMNRWRPHCIAGGETPCAAVPSCAAVPLPCSDRSSRVLALQDLGIRCGQGSKKGQVRKAMCSWRRAAPL